jgi:hypothetical protein
MYYAAARVRLLVSVLLLAACGDNGDPCDYHEADDTGNASSAEPTSITVGERARSVCGAIDGGHYDPVRHAVDSDAFRVTVAGSGELLVELSGDELGVLDEVSVRLFDTAPEPTLLAEGALAPAFADRAAFVAHVSPGDVDVVVEARAGGDLQGTLDYRVRLANDPSLACPAQQGNPRYVEARDGSDDTGNDVALVDFAQSPSFTPDPSSAPEPTDFPITAGYAYRISGVAGPGGRGDAYLDRDTYAIATDDTTNELAIRLDWPDNTVDLDYILFQPDTLAPIAVAARASTSDHEFAVVAVQPSTTYWLWVGRYAKPQGGPAADYDVTVCGRYAY